MNDIDNTANTIDNISSVGKADSFGDGLSSGSPLVEKNEGESLNPKNTREEKRLSNLEKFWSLQSGFTYTDTWDDTGEIGSRSSIMGALNHLDCVFVSEVNYLFEDGQLKTRQYTKLVRRYLKAREALEKAYDLLTELTGARL